MSAEWRVIEGDCRDVLATLPAESIHTCVTSPPYFGLRDYGEVGQIGLEPTPDDFVAALVDVFRGVRRVLRDDGTVWLNLGDSYNADGRKGRAHMGEGKNNGYSAWVNKTMDGTKPKDLLGIPWMVAFALRADGWYLRSDIVWSKPNPMPESVTDRPTKAHEYVFLLSKGPRYFYDAGAIREEPSSDATDGRRGDADATQVARLAIQSGGRGATHMGVPHAGRNKRSVWTVATQPHAGAHFATFPPKLIEPCILAGAPERACGECGAPWVRVVEAPKYEPPTVEAGVRAVDASRGDKTRKLDGKSAEWREAANRRTVGFEPSCTCRGQGSAIERGGASTTRGSITSAPVPGVVLDPFAGSGTTGMVALRHGRSFVGVELSPAYAAMARERIVGDAPLLNSVAEVA